MKQLMMFTVLILGLILGLGLVGCQTLSDTGGDCATGNCSDGSCSK